jgi:FERM/RhoGEF/pleckstrin domain protein 2
MHHSHSTPAGVDGGARTPPATPKKGGKMLAIRVQMLDDAVTIFQVQMT